MARRAAFAGCGALGCGAVVVWDYKTCHPSRRYDFGVGSLYGTGIRVHNAVIAPLVGKSYTMAELGTYDGADGRPTYVGCGGRIFDVSDSEMFKTTYTGWAGKDATVSLGLMSLDDDDANRRDWEVLGEDEWKGVSDWKLYFDSKYRVRGTLAEFEAFRKSGKCTVAAAVAQK